MNEPEIYNTPKSDLLDSTNIEAEDVERILAIAKRQKALVYTFLVYFLLSFSLSAVPEEIRPLVQLLALPLMLAILILTARLALKVYGKFTAIIMAILSLIPLINLLVVLSASSRANAIIKKAGFRVGLVGADTKEIEALLNK